MKITLIRHGKPDFDWSLWVRSEDIKNLIKAYDTADIVGTPPYVATLLIEQHNYIVCSDLHRSAQSAQALGVKIIDLTRSIYREMSIPYFDSGRLKLPLTLWIGILRLLWFMGLSKNAESLAIAKKRAKLAAKSLIKLAKEHESVLLVGHGFLNHYVAKELLLHHWQSDSKLGKNYWEYATYSYDSSH